MHEEVEDPVQLPQLVEQAKNKFDNLPTQFSTPLSKYPALQPHWILLLLIVLRVRNEVVELHSKQV